MSMFTFKANIAYLFSKFVFLFRVNTKHSEVEKALCSKISSLKRIILLAVARIFFSHYIPNMREFLVYKAAT